MRFWHDVSSKAALFSQLVRVWTHLEASKAKRGPFHVSWSILLRGLSLKNQLFLFCKANSSAAQFMLSWDAHQKQDIFAFLWSLGCFKHSRMIKLLLAHLFKQSIYWCCPVYCVDADPWANNVSDPSVLQGRTLCRSVFPTETRPHKCVTKPPFFHQDFREPPLNLLTWQRKKKWCLM